MLLAKGAYIVLIHFIKLLKNSNQKHPKIQQKKSGKQKEALNEVVSPGVH
jgi:hypothetical protein